MPERRCLAFLIASSIVLRGTGFASGPAFLASASTLRAAAFASAIAFALSGEDLTFDALTAASSCAFLNASRILVFLTASDAILSASLENLVGFSGTSVDGAFSRDVIVGLLPLRGIRPVFLSG